MRTAPLAPLPLLCLLAAACTGPGDAQPLQHPPPVEVLDDRGERLALPAPPSRIVSLVPSATDLLVALGAADRLVGRTRYDRAPELDGVASLGGGLDPNLEALVALRPDLVIVSPFEAARAALSRLEGMGIPLYAARTGTLEDVRTLAGNLGHLLGPPMADRARVLLDSLEAGLEALARERADGPRPTVFYLVWDNPPMTVGPGSYLDDLIRAAGGRNVFDDAPSPWPQVSLEEIVRRQPDWVILSGREAGGEERLRWIREAPGWRELRAVQEGRVQVVEGDLFNRPGPRLLEAARTLAASIHP